MVKLFGGLRFPDSEEPEAAETLAVRADVGSFAQSFPLDGFACRNNRASIMLRCWSRTEMLRWSCSRMVGSWVVNPGERQAIPTSLKVERFPPAVRGTCGPEGSALSLRRNFGGR